MWQTIALSSRSPVTQCKANQNAFTFCSDSEATNRGKTKFNGYFIASFLSCHIFWCDGKRTQWAHFFSMNETFNFLCKTKKKKNIRGRRKSLTFDSSEEYGRQCPRTKHTFFVSVAFSHEIHLENRKNGWRTATTLDYRVVRLLHDANNSTHIKIEYALARNRLVDFDVWYAK